MYVEHCTVKKTFRLNKLIFYFNFQENDMSDEMFNQHAAISDLQQAEELAVDQHKSVNEFLTEFLPETRKLYAMTNYVEYDQDGECWSVIRIIENFQFQFLYYFSVLQKWHHVIQSTYLNG